MLNIKNILLYSLLFIAVFFGNYAYHNFPRDSAVLELTGDFTNLGVSDTTPIVAYTASWCNVCKELKLFLSFNKINYVDIDIDEDKNALDLLDKYGIKGVPVIVINGRLIQGFDSEILTKYLINKEDSNATE